MNSLHDALEAFVTTLPEEGRQKLAEAQQGGYDLRAELRNILDTTDLTDPGEITDKVIATIPPDALVDVLRQVLRPYVQNFLGTDRLRLIQSSSSDHRFNDAHCRPAAAGQPLDRESGSQSSADSHDGRAAAPRSWKRDGIRDIFRSRMPGQGKMLGDCTVEDITAAAIERETLSAKNAAWAVRYRKLAKRMEQYHVTLVSELSPDLVRDILQGAPA